MVFVYLEKKNEHTYGILQWHVGSIMYENNFNSITRINNMVFQNTSF